MPIDGASVESTHEHMRKSASEEGSVDCAMSTTFGAVDVLTARAVELDGLLEWLIG